MKNKEKKELYNTKLKQLEDIFKEIHKDKKELVQGLIEQSCFMYVQLTELNEIIQKKGVVDNFKQGKQQFYREHPATKTYNAMIKNYNLTIKQLIEYLPEKKQITPDDEFLEFQKKRK